MSLLVVRRFARFRLRTLLILIAFIACVLGYWSFTARRQREAIENLARFNVRTGYDFEEHFLERSSLWPAWLVEALGVDYFASVVRVVFHGNNAAGLEFINQFPRLHTVNIPASGVADADLVYLEGLTTLHTIWLERNGVTDVGLHHLRALTGLETLDLAETHVGNEGLAQLTRLTRLTYLGLEKSLVTDAGLVHLAALHHLEILNLNGTQVSDEGLLHLARLTALEELYLVDTNVSEAGVERLKKALPNCHVRYGKRPSCDDRAS